MPIARALNRMSPYLPSSKAGQKMAPPPGKQRSRLEQAIPARMLQRVVQLILALSSPLQLLKSVRPSSHKALAVSLVWRHMAGKTPVPCPGATPLVYQLDLIVAHCSAP